MNKFIKNTHLKMLVRCYMKCLKETSFYRNVYFPLKDILNSRAHCPFSIFQI